ncbi:T9SS type A sorting domain-containing protein [uncultured Muribaculum sp.]|jgi:hypothetical protein|uniref:T9SS type A sorting domain-containing protein n=2 Tax=uncultured Muribaculum sp. TaxID=1918613 RepID=UPI0025AEDE0C|nr:T9SS type A sorting domain-containing protein [uncultured Muribaculum sp.]
MCHDMNLMHQKRACLRPVWLTALVLCVWPMHAQTVVFEYDNGGNRVRREAQATPQVQPAKAPPAKPGASPMLTDGISIGPNPTTGIVKVEITGFGTGSVASICVYNTSGQLLLKTKATDPATEINIAGRPDGVYIFNVETGKSKTRSMIVKQ